jgi:hypothetical protein
MLLALAFALATSAGANRVEAISIDLSTVARSSNGAEVDLTPTAIRVSGEVSDDVWQRATATDAFLQREPAEGGEPSQRTEFRVAYDSTTLYVKVRAFDTEPGKIVSSRAATATRRRTGCASSSIRTTTSGPRTSSPSIPPA